MPQSPDRTQREELQNLLSKICVDWGFCIPPEPFDEISSCRSITAGEFANAVLKAEGMNPDYEKEWFRKLKRRFIEEFEQESISSEDLEL
ncbi:MAG: hypothetical protein IPM25_12575 [Chloracidobacterium sp.]|nr:hypothetical protein [Chloracidobacterium sp.]